VKALENTDYLLSLLFEYSVVSATLGSFTVGTWTNKNGSSQLGSFIHS
jgi:hypothetical protein